MDAPAHITLDTLSAFADGELAPAEGLSVQAHVDTCVDCRLRLSRFARISAALSATAPGFPERLLVSAFLDGETSPIERRVTSAHLATCPDCRAALGGFRAADVALRALPLRAPSPAADAGIAALVGQAPLTGRPRLAFSWALPRMVIAAMAVAVVLLSALGVPAADVARLPIDGALVASAQQVVFNVRTNTLYVLDAEHGQVTAVDASTKLEQARIVVGGRPTALALNEPTNTILVLDGGLKWLTEIDTRSNTVVSAATINVGGTPTSMQVDPQGRIVVSSVLAPSPVGAGSPDVARTGQVTVLDGASKKVESVKTVDVPAQSVVFDPAGKRALLLSADSTTVADAATYRAIEHLPGGVAATFDVSGQRVAVLGSRQGVAELALFGDAGTTTVTLAGTPVAIIALPDGGFGVLLRSGSLGHIAIVGPDAKVRTTLDVALSGNEITFDAVSARFAVIGGSGVAYAATGPAATAVTRPADPSAPPSAALAVQAAPSPAAASASPAPNRPRSPEPAVAVSSGSLPPGAQLAWTGVYRLEAPGGRRPLRVAGSGARIWFVDQTMTLATIDTATGTVAMATRLPADWSAGPLLVGERLVVAIDNARGRVAVYDKTLERSDIFDFAFTQSARSFALAPDDRLWMGAPQGGTLIALDLRLKRAQAVDTGASGISAISVDSGGHVSYADPVRPVLGSYDGGSHRLTEVPVTRVGRITSLLTDGAGTRWAGTDAGELIAQRADGTTRTLIAPGAIQSLALDAAGGIWFTSSAAAGVAFGPATDLARVQLGPQSVTGLSFDSQGSAWAADRAGAFYIVKQDR